METIQGQKENRICERTNEEMEQYVHKLLLHEWDNAYDIMYGNTI